MKLRYIFAGSVFFVVNVIAYNNCDGGFKTMDGVTLTSLSSNQCKLTPFRPTGGKVAHKVSTDVLPAESEIAVVLDNECLRDSSLHGRLTREIIEQKNVKPNDGTTATVVSLQLHTQISGSRLTTDANNDPCVLKVDREDKMQLFSEPNDPGYSAQPALQYVKHSNIYPQVYNESNGINQIVRISVIDSGVDTTHPDLASLFLRDTTGKLIALNGIDNSGNVSDSGFHGTHVTGIAAAIGNNGIGISGVLGDYARVLPVKASADGTSISTSAVASGIIWAADNGAHVVNMSLGGKNYNEVMVDAIKYAISKGVFIAVAAGNDGKVLASQIDIYPAMYSADHSGMVTVGSISAESGQVSSFSNRSPAHVDIMAPGSVNTSTGILSTVPTNLSSSGYANAGKTDSGEISPIQGTSMASPMVAGAAAAAIALVRSRGYDALPSQVEELFSAGSPSISSYTSYTRGGKSLDLASLIAKVDQDTSLSISGSASRSQARGNVGITTQPQSQNINAGQTLTLSVAKSSSSAIFVNYQWYKDGVRIVGANFPTLTIPSVFSGTAGRYKVELKAGTNSITSNDAVVTVDGSSIPAPTPTPSGSNPDPVQPCI